MSDREGAAGKALQGPAIKQKLILTCTAKGEAAAVRGNWIKPAHSSSDIRHWHVRRPGQHAKSCYTLSCTCTGILLPPSALSQSAAASSGANQERGSLLEMLRGWGEGTVSKSYPVRQGCIKIHTELEHQPEYWWGYRSCPAVPLRGGKKGIFTLVSTLACFSTYI